MARATITVPKLSAIHWEDHTDVVPGDFSKDSFPCLYPDPTPASLQSLGTSSLSTRLGMGHL